MCLPALLECAGLARDEARGLAAAAAAAAAEGDAPPTATGDASPVAGLQGPSDAAGLLLRGRFTPCNAKSHIDQENKCTVGKT